MTELSWCNPDFNTGHVKEKAAIKKWRWRISFQTFLHSLKFWVSLYQRTSNKTIFVIRNWTIYVKYLFRYKLMILAFQRCQVCSLYYLTQDNLWFILIHRKHLHYPCNNWWNVLTWEQNIQCASKNRQQTRICGTKAYFHTSW